MWTVYVEHSIKVSATLTRGGRFDARGRIRVRSGLRGLSWSRGEPPNHHIRSALLPWCPSCFSEPCGSRPSRTCSYTCTPSYCPSRPWVRSPWNRCCCRETGRTHNPYGCIYTGARCDDRTTWCTYHPFPCPCHPSSALPTTPLRTQPNIPTKPKKISFSLPFCYFLEASEAMKVEWKK